MKNWRIHSIPALGLLLYFLLWKALCSWLGYMLDSDAVAYLTVAERVGRGEYIQSINGLWSPLNSWLLLLFSHENMNFFYRAQLWNLLIGGILLIQTWMLMRLFQVKWLVAVMHQFALSVVMVYLVYYQVFADLLQCVFLMSYLLYWQFRAYKNTVPDAVFIGLIIGFGFYAKAYTWVFFVLHFALMQFYLCFQKKQTFKQGLVRYILAVVTSVSVMLPWIIALHQKYGVWTITGLAGKLNMSWYINSGKTFKPDIKLLIPPAHANSPSFWEDPYLSQSILTGPFTNLDAFIHWVIRVFHTTLSAIGCYSELSFLALVCIFWSIYYFLLNSKHRMFFQGERSLLFALLVLPLGYLAMHIETRYLWLSLFLLPVLFNQFYVQLKVQLKYFVLVIWVFSFLVFPVLQIESLREKNKDLFYAASDLRHAGFQSVKFTSTVPDEGRMWVLAYLTKSQCYTIEANTFQVNELEQEMQRYQVPYVIMEKSACIDGFI
ncbi:MAG: hypothetical protein FGM54_08800, partial [Chitinophagaceae bacterium]|nr:hypothetical protein [Chitinophagaceae bacterium]